LFGIRDATLIHLFDRDRRTRFDLSGHAVIHTAPNVRRVPVGPEHPAGYAPVCVGTTTSLRMERFTRPLLQRLGVRAIIGKGGLGEDSAAAFRSFGAVYLAVVGGAAALQTTWIERIDDVDLDDLNPESLWRFAVRDFGPLLVTMDARGGDLHEAARVRASRNRAAVLAGLGVEP
jgi:L(+)-tartrate dehydratase beta subunit